MIDMKTPTLSVTKSLEADLQAYKPRITDFGIAPYEADFDDVQPAADGEPTVPLQRILGVDGEPTFLQDSSAAAAPNAANAPTIRLRYTVENGTGSTKAAAETRPVRAVLIPKIGATAMHEPTLSGDELFQETFPPEPVAGDALSMISHETPDQWLNNQQH